MDILLFMFNVCLCNTVLTPLQPCDHLLRNGRPLGFLVCCVKDIINIVHVYSNFGNFR